MSSVNLCSLAGYYHCGVVNSIFLSIFRPGRVDMSSLAGRSHTIWSGMCAIHLTQGRSKGKVLGRAYLGWDYLYNIMWRRPLLLQATSALPLAANVTHS